MLEYGQFLVLASLTTGVVLVALYFSVSLVDYAFTLWLDRYSQMIEIKAKMLEIDQKALGE